MAGVREKLLTASDLAALCEVDLKTIHNWVDRGRIAHFRTPGRHLRFRAADVADFLRAWGYSVPRELARASSRTMLVVGTKETALLVARAIGEASAAVPGVAGAQAGAASSPLVLPVTLTPGAPKPVSKPGMQSSEQGPPKPPIRQVAHPYDALVYAGSDPADVYIVDVRAVAADIDVSAMLEALHRASPQAAFVALSDEAAALPAFATRVSRGDLAALRAALGSEGPGAAGPQAGQAPGAAGQITGSPIRQASSGIADRLGSASAGVAGSKGSAAIATVPAARREEKEEEDEAPPRGVAVGGLSR